MCARYRKNEKYRITMNTQISRRFLSPSRIICTLSFEHLEMITEYSVPFQPSTMIFLNFFF